jgi:hypothetical protein
MIYYEDYFSEVFSPPFKISGTPTKQELDQLVEYIDAFQKRENTALEIYKTDIREKFSKWPDNVFDKLFDFLPPKHYSQCYNEIYREVLELEPLIDDILNDH